eukprot:GSA25T00027642001.1
MLYVEVQVSGCIQSASRSIEKKYEMAMELYEMRVVVLLVLSYIIKRDTGTGRVVVDDVLQHDIIRQASSIENTFT